jgi:hypothetical protein
VARKKNGGQIKTGLSFFFKKRLKWVKTGLFYKMGTGGLKILSPLSFFSYVLLFILFYKKYHIF